MPCSPVPLQPANTIAALSNAISLLVMDFPHQPEVFLLSSQASSLPIKSLKMIAASRGMFGCLPELFSLLTRAFLRGSRTSKNVRST
jgi:hypothetical protein